MKRTLFLLLLALLTLLSACGSPAEPLPLESPAESESATETEAETAPATETEAVTETEPVTEAVTEAEPATEAVTETELVTEAVTETEPVTEAITETEPATEAVTETEPATEAVTETEPATESVMETEPVTEIATETEPVTEAVTETAPVTEVATETEPVTEAITETEPATEAVTETEPATEAETTPPAEMMAYPALILGELPAYVGARTDSETIQTGDDCQMLYIKGAAEADFHNYCATLADAGWERYATHEAANNLFATYINDSRIATVYYMAKTSQLRILEEPRGSLAPRAEDVEPYETIREPTVRLAGQAFPLYPTATEVINNGLYMIFRLSDGRLIVIDGGYGFDSTIPGWFIDNLRDMAYPNDVTIAAWIVTHAHGDHVDGFLDSILYTSAPFVIEQVIVNLPDLAATPIADGDSGDIPRMRNWMNAQTYADIVKAHTGQVYHYADAAVEILYTFEDCLPRGIDRLNTTSLVCRVTLGDQTVMVLGDCSNIASGILVENYGSYLKSDIVQLAHHGFEGGTPELYREINAPVMLWPSRWQSVILLAEYAYTRADFFYNRNAIDLAADIFVAGDTVTDLPLPYTPTGNKASIFPSLERWIANSPK